VNLRELGESMAAELRAEAGLPTPVDDLLTLKELAEIIDCPGVVNTTPRRRNTALPMATRGRSRAAS
jgi:hypothetical protein